MDSIHELAQKLQKEILFCEREDERLDAEIARLREEKTKNLTKKSEHGDELRICLAKIGNV